MIMYHLFEDDQTIILLEHQMGLLDEEVPIICHELIIELLDEE